MLDPGVLVCGGACGMAKESAMRVPSMILVSLLAGGLIACGGAQKDAKGPETDVWSGYKGTYATPADPNAKAASKTSVAKDEKHEGKAKADTKEGGDKDEASLPPAPATKKTASKKMIKGESVSSITSEGLADAAKAALGAKSANGSITIGSQYEQVNVTVKGATVQIIRPAANPDPSGPAVSAPKTRSGELAKSEAAVYDEEADVLILVTSNKKATSQKALGSLVKGGMKKP
jgi:hypothetical protein